MLPVLPVGAVLELLSRPSTQERLRAVGQSAAAELRSLAAYLKDLKESSK